MKKTLRDQARACSLDTWGVIAGTNALDRAIRADDELAALAVIHRIKSAGGPTEIRAMAEAIDREVAT